MQRLLLAVGLSTLLFCGLAYSQGQPFSQYVTGLPAATTPLGPGDKFYVLQGGISKAVSAPNVLSGGVVNSISNADGTLTISPTTGSVTASANYNSLAFTAPAHQFINRFSNGFISAQPSAADISGLGTMATQNANAVAITGGSITGMPAPSLNADVATKAYVDANASGLTPHASVRLATAAQLPAYTFGAAAGGTLTSTANGPLSVDGVPVAVNDRILVKNEPATGVACNGTVLQACDGVYTVDNIGSGVSWVMHRVADFNAVATGNVAFGASFAVTAGTQINQTWALAGTGAITLNTTPLIFNLVFGGASGIVNPGAQNSVAYYPNSGTANTVGPVAPAANAVLGTSAGSVPSLSTTLPAGLTMPSPTFTGTITGLPVTPVTGGRLVAASPDCTNAPSIQFANNAAAPVICYVPFLPGTGNLIWVNGANLTFTTQTLTLDATHHLAGKLYDVFEIAGPAICAGGNPWSAPTINPARTDAVGSLANGLYANTGTLAHCWNNSADLGPVSAGAGTYLGTCYMISNGNTIWLPSPTPVTNGSPAYLGCFNAYNQQPTFAFEGEGATTNITYNAANTSGGFSLYKSWGANGTSNTTNRIYWVDGLGQNTVNIKFNLSGISTSAGPNGGSVSTCMDGTGGTTAGANQYNCPNGGPYDWGTVNTAAWGANNLGGVVDSNPPARTWSLANQIAATNASTTTLPFYHERWFSMMGLHFAQQLIVIYSGGVTFTNNSATHTIPNNASWTVSTVQLPM